MPTSPQGILTWMEDNPVITIGGVVLALLVGGSFIRKQMPTPTTPTAAGNTTGLLTDANGNPVVFVPTSTSWSTTTINKRGNTYNYPTTPTPPPKHKSGDGDKKEDKGDGPPIHGKPIPQSPPQPGPKPPNPSPKPPKHGNGNGNGNGNGGHTTTGYRVWDQSHTVLAGETLASIAAGIQGWIRAHATDRDGQTMTVSASDIYHYNSQSINNQDEIHHAAQGTVFPGMVLITCRWQPY